MRLWSFHPKYLDNVGLSRAINEGISGFKALDKQQKMWQNHSQLIRFKVPKGDIYLSSFLRCLIIERYNRNINQIYCEDTFQIKMPKYKEENFSYQMIVTKDQLVYEWNHYLNKLKVRDKNKYAELRGILIPEPHPIFKIVEGDIEHWENCRDLKLIFKKHGVK